MDFNPTLGLILTLIVQFFKNDENEFQSYLRSNSDYIVCAWCGRPLMHFNPTLGLILTLYISVGHLNHPYIFQSYLRSNSDDCDWD